MTPPKREIEVNEALEPWVERVIEVCLSRHKETCSLFDRVGRLERRWAWWVGFMVGSGILGGTVGAALASKAGPVVKQAALTIFGGGV